MPEYYEMDQRSEDWARIRAAIPSASNFSKIITPKTCKISSSAGIYASALVASMYLSRPLMNDSTPFMDRGIVLENEAFDNYEFETGNKVKKVGFAMSSNRLWGCSPDALVGDDGLVELKCLSENGHMEFYFQQDEKDLMKIDEVAKYYPQIQGQMFVCERKWCDLYGYIDSGLPTVCVRVPRDDEFIEKLAQSLDKFWTDYMLPRIKKLTDDGYLEDVARPADFLKDQTILDAG